MKSITRYFLILLLLEGACDSGPREPSPFQKELAKARTTCATDGKSKEILADILDHTELDGLAVFVKRDWYNLTLRHKEAYAAALTACYSPKDYVAIYDAYTGKQLAMWGSYGLKMKD